MLTPLYKGIALLVFYIGFATWMESDAGFVRLPAIICSMLAFEYLLGWFNEFG